MTIYMAKTRRGKKRTKRGTRKQTKRSDTIATIIKKNPIVLFIKYGCPYCAKAINIMHLEGVKPKLVPLSGKRGELLQERLFKKTGRRTVPNVFIGGKSIGGSDETERLHLSGELRKKLKAATRSL